MRLSNLLPLSFLFSSSPSLAHSNEHDVSSICHKTPSGEVDCYPKVFVPTEEFQIIKEDQEIPSGLHVRLNLKTGLKEAKLYDGNDDETTNAVEVLSDGSQRTSDPVASPAEGLPNLNLEQSDQKLLQPPSDQGPIRPPPPNSPDGTTFTTNRAILLSSSTSSPDETSLVPALSSLEDLSHGIYWGHHLAQDSAAIHKLHAFLSPTALASTSLKSATALLLGTALQNNPAALSAALSHFYTDSHPTGPLETVLLALLHEQVPALTARLVFLLSELCQDRGQLVRFLRAEGMDVLRALYEQRGTEEARERLRGKISNFVLDHFLVEGALGGFGPESEVHGAGAEATKASAAVRVSGSKGEKKREKEEGEDERSQEPLDDAWVLVEKLPPATESSLKAIPQYLHPWCASFEKSIDGWTAQKAASRLNPEAQTAQERAVEAHEALELKLEEYGCGCKQVVSECKGSRVKGQGEP